MLDGTPLARSFAATLALVLVAATTIGCGKKEDPASPTTPPAKTADATKPSEPAKTSPGWKDPPGWKRNPPTNAMRVAEYVLPRLSGDVEDAECVVTTFGAGQGGSVDANIDRWVRQFEPDAASGLDKSAKTVAGMKVTTIDLAGTYKGSGMPGAGASGPKKSWRMTAAIVETPKGMYFFKLTGPDPTVKSARSAFDAMLDTLTP